MVQWLKSRFLNVITGRPAAKIFIDGELVGSDFIRKYPLMEGEHYVRIEFKGQLMYAKMVLIEPNKLRTITSESFVDIRTKTANRGAVNRESQRLRETKGNVALGVQWGDTFPAKGMSIKWFSPLAIGVQFSAIGKTEMDVGMCLNLVREPLFQLGIRFLVKQIYQGFHHRCGSTNRG